jgi:hypothetical protein
MRLLPVDTRPQRREFMVEERLINPLKLPGVSERKRGHSEFPGAWQADLIYASLSPSD